MKRKAIESTSDAPRGRRQPQTSCDSCRRKKLKCDRAAPCNNCVVRGLACQGQPPQHPERDTPPADSTRIPTASDLNNGILDRLSRLESAVFGPKPMIGAQVALHTGAEKEGHPIRQGTDKVQPVFLDEVPASASTPDEDERRQAAKLLDLGLTNGTEDAEHSALTLNGEEPVLHKQPELIVSSISQADNISQESPARSFILMTRNEAQCLLLDFINNPVHLLPIIHQPTAHSVIDQLYGGLHEGGMPQRRLAYASLTFAIAATSAFFYHSESEVFGMFETPEHAAKASMKWLRASLDLFDLSKHQASFCLEDVQARVIIANLLYSIEGCSFRYRFIHHSCILLGREIGLHLLDSPRSNHKDDIPTKEIKRRLWWYMISTDWMLGFMGGPLEGTYVIHPRHMNVKPPRNINDRDLEIQDEAFAYSEDVPTDVSFLIQRARLGETCREALDSRPIGAPEEDIMDRGRVLALDRAFEKALSDLPPFFQPHAPIPDGAPKCLALHRNTILLATHSRRARINRPFLLKDDPDETHQLLRKNCLSSARTAALIATEMLESSRAQPQSHPGPMVISLSRRMGIVIGHLFAACAVLALNAAIHRDKCSQPGEASTSLSGANDEDEDLKKACSVLTAVGEETAVAASLVRTLKGVLRRSRGHIARPSFANEVSLSDDHTLEPVQNETSQELSMLRPIISGDVEMRRTEEDLELERFWTEIADADPDRDPWDQLFAGLDVYFGSS